MIGMNARTGRALSDIEHLRQSIADILTTPVGSRIKRREYGSLIPELIDRPLNGATVVQLYAATAAALIRWEPRIRLTGARLSAGMNGAATLDLEGVVNAEAVQLSIPINGASA